MYDALVFDLGGTNCRLGLTRNTALSRETVRSHKNSEFDTLEALLTRYLDEQKVESVSSVCAAVAGPVKKQSAQLTNHPWRIEASTLSDLTGAHSVELMNDLQAQAYALCDLPASGTEQLIGGKPDPHGPRMVMCLGTGCNIATAHMIGDRVFVPASESGHTTLPDVPAYRELYDWLRTSEPHLPTEAALGARGLSRIHEYLTGHKRTSHEIFQQDANETLEKYLTILSLVAGNLCLANMATGGLFLIGGLARAIAPHIKEQDFRKHFTARGPYSEILQNIPVSIVQDDAAALVGCTFYLNQASKHR